MSDDAPDDVEEPKERLQISLSQMAASSLAAVSAAVLCSLFGVAGTVIGTAVASVLFTIGSALYVHTLRRTKARLRRMHQAGAASPPFREVIKTARQQGRRLAGQIPWRVAGIGSAVVFVVSIGVITAIEAGAGETLSELFGVSHSGAHSTSLGSTLNPKHHHHKAKPTPTVTETVTATPTSSAPLPSTSATPTKTPTKKPTHSPTHSPSKTPTPTPTPTSPTATGSP